MTATDSAPALGMIPEDPLTDPWPIVDDDLLQFARIGDQLAEELTLAHYGAQAWVLGIDEMTQLTLVGTANPGEIYFALPDLTDWLSYGRDTPLEGDYAHGARRSGEKIAPSWTEFFEKDPTPEEAPDA